MNPSDWIYHLSLRTTLLRNEFLDPCPADRERCERVHRARGRGKVIAGAALLVPALLVAAGLLGG